MTFRKFIVVLALMLNGSWAVAQIDTVFWFAAPWVTPDHWWRDNVVLHISTFAGPTTTVHIRQPGIPSSSQNRYDTIIQIPPNTNFDYVFWRDKIASSTNLGYDSLEVKPANQTLPYGLYISSSANITVVYDVITRPTSYLNPETFSLKGQNGLGTEFVCPQQTNWHNQFFSNNACGANAGDLNCDGIVSQPKQQINIVATQSNTVVWITPRCNVVGNHPALVTYSIMLSVPGMAYTIENVTQSTNVTGQNLSGTIIVSDKPIAVTVADDSVAGVTGCFDLMGDQIVPVDIVGKDYVVIKGAMNAPEYEGAYIVGTENFTKLTINDGTVTIAYINKGDTYYYKTTQLLTSVIADKNVYVLHATGYGCELGEALLPPLSCAGSSIVAFSRNNDQPFRLNIMCKTGTQGSFTLSPSALVPASAFAPVPGNPGYMGAQLVFSTVQIAPNSSYTIANTMDVFAIGVFNGNTTTGGLYHYMSSFLRRTSVQTATIPQICAGGAGTVAVTGTISGAALTGSWSTSYVNGSVTVNGGGTGAFNSTYNSTLNVISTVYNVSINDTTPQNLTSPTKTITLYLTSTGVCKNVTDSVKLIINQRPRVSVGTGTTMCKNNILPIALNGTVDPRFALSGSWSGGTGAFGAPGPVTTYTPSFTDLQGNGVTLTLTSINPLQGCSNVSKTLSIVFNDPPVVDPGQTMNACTNSYSIHLSGSITGTAGGYWLGGTGAYTVTNATPSTTYILSPADLTQSAIIFTLTANPAANCASESRTVALNIIQKPTVITPSITLACANNGVILLTGTVSGAATSGTWTSGTGSGIFQQPQITSPVTATYILAQQDIDKGNVTFTLTSMGGICPPQSDTVRISILDAPKVSVLTPTAACENAPIPLQGFISGFVTTGVWSHSSGSQGGTYVPDNKSLNSLYYPSQFDLQNGSVVFTLTADNGAVCPPAVTAILNATFIKAPVANFNPAKSICLNAPLLFNNTSQANGTDQLSYAWDFGDGSPTGRSTAVNPLYTYTNSGSYLVTLTVTGLNTQFNTVCPDTVVKQVLVKPLPVPEFSMTNICQNYPVKFTDFSYFLPPYDPRFDIIDTWTWNFGDSQFDTTYHTQPPGKTFTLTFPNATAMDVMLTIRTKDGCYAGPLHKSINVSPQPKAEFGMTNNPSVVEEPVYFSDFTKPVGNIASWYWEFGDDGASTDQAPSHNYVKAGIYSIKLTVIDLNGCVDTLRKPIEVSLLPSVPSGFTPNNDGNNDLLKVKGGPFYNMIFRVYNNWGELLFETTDQSIGWDGRYHGVDQPAGVYVWTLIVDMYNNRQVRKNGDVTLIR